MSSIKRFKAGCLYLGNYADDPNDAITVEVVDRTETTATVIHFDEVQRVEIYADDKSEYILVFDSMGFKSTHRADRELAPCKEGERPDWYDISEDLFELLLISDKNGKLNKRQALFLKTICNNATRLLEPKDMED